MLKAIRLPYEEDGSWWTICPISGSLIRHSHKPEHEFDRIPLNVKNALSICDNPYTCKWTHIKSADTYDLGSKKFNELITMHDRLLRISNRRFLFLKLYASFMKPMFETTYQAMGAISQITEQLRNREERCLQRSLLSAKTSKSFRKNGVLFIGAMTTNSDMHAWIIESGSQPDHEDRGWINYRPLLALVQNDS
jgi:hypothetical protein